MQTTKQTKPTNVTRTGGTWEGIGFVLIVIGMLLAFMSVGIGGSLVAIGFGVFLMGRFK